MNKKKLLLLAMCGTCMSTTALARMDGFYVGANVGLSFPSAEAKRTAETPHTSLSKLKKTTLLAGVAIGYDFIVNNFLIGLVVEAETDLGKAKQEKKALTTIQLQQYTTQDLTANKTWDLKLTGKRQFSIGGKLKLGYLFTDACVLYVAPGYSYTNYKITATMTDTTPGTTPKKGNAKVGKGSFVVSGGIGYNIYENWVMSAEYTFGGKATKKIKDTAGKEVIRYTYKHQSVKLGIKYVF